MTSSGLNRLARRADADVARTVLASAQLLALNAALGGAGDECAGSMLAVLVRDLRQPPPAPKRSRARAGARR